MIIDSEGGTGAGELDDEDEEEDDHVEEEHDLVMLHGSNQTHNWDKEKEDSAGCDTTNNWKTCDVALCFAWREKELIASLNIKSFICKSLTVDSHPHHEEGHQDVNDIEPHQGVFGARKAPTHDVWKLWKNKFLLLTMRST